MPPKKRNSTTRACCSPSRYESHRRDVQGHEVHRVLRNDKVIVKRCHRTNLRACLACADGRARDHNPAHQGRRHRDEVAAFADLHPIDSRESRYASWTSAAVCSVRPARSLRMW